MNLKEIALTQTLYFEYSASIKFEFDDAGVTKADLKFDGKSLVLIPMIGDWVQPDKSIPREVTKRIFVMGDQSNTIILRCQ